jgi:RNA-directed DNA polymerase
MKEPNIEGVTNHDDPESCAVAREGVGEAWTGARAGRVFSREISQTLGRRRRSGRRKAIREDALFRERHRGPARSKTPRMHGVTMRENWEISLSPDAMARRDESGRRVP